MMTKTENIEKNTRSMRALYVQEGSIDRFIASVAEMQANYQEVIRSLTETIADFSRAERSRLKVKSLPSIRPM